MEIIKEELNKVLENITEDFSDPFSDNVLKNFIAGSSKRIRSSLAILYLKSLNCNINENIYRICAAGEILHNASLFHDDVIDCGEIRRGEITISKRFSPKIAVLAGDYLIAVAIEKLLKINNDRIIKIFKDTCKNMAEAEIKQYFLRGETPSEDEYIEICKGKTARLFSAILKSCAILANISEKNAEYLGECFGICFQISNDLEEKSSEEDIKNGIKTAKDIFGIENAKILSDNYKKEIQKLLSEQQDNDYKRALRDLVNRL